MSSSVNPYTTTDTVNLLFGLVKLQYPHLKLDLKFPLPYFGTQTISIPQSMLKFTFYLGMATTLYYTLKFTYRSVSWFWTYFKSFFNAKKYLKSQTSEDASRRYYAIIYGAANRAGNSFAHYLASKGFNLILIDRDPQPLNDLENDIKSLMRKSLTQPDIIKVTLNKFDYDHLSRALHPTKDLPIKMFINCKNSKRKSATPVNSYGNTGKTLFLLW